MITPLSLAIILQSAPFPGAVFTVTPGGAALDLTIDGATITFCEGAWFAAERRTTPAHLSFTATPTAAQVHAEIRRVLAIVNTPAEPSPTWAEIKADCVGPELPNPYIPTIAEIADEPSLEDALHDRLTDEIDRRRDAEQALAKVTAERDALIVAESTLSKIAAALAIPALEPYDDALSMVKRLVDGYTVVSQRLVGSQKEVAEVTKRATKAEARVKRLLRQRSAAHDVLDEAGIGLEPEGSPRWTLARRCRAAVEPVWGYLDALQAFDVVGESVGVTGKTGERGFMDAVIARVKALHQEDADLLRLVSYHQAPIKFNNRPLTLAERAAFVIRRLWQGRTNAAAEAAALRRELGDIADALGDLPDTAEREPIGDREDHIGLSTAERIRLSR